MRNFLLYIRQILGIWFLYLLVRVLLVVVGCIRSRLILMGLLSNTKLGWLQKDTFNSILWIMRRYFPLLQKWLLFMLLLSYLRFVSSISLNLMLKIPSWMEIFKKKFIWRPFLVFNMTLGMFISSRKRYMVLNKHPVLGLRNFMLWSLLLDLFLVVMIRLSFLSVLLQVVSFYLYMLMTWLLLVMTLMVF